MTRLENCSHDPDKIIYNFSDYKLTERGKSALRKDLKCAIQPNKLECAAFIMPLELFVILRAMINQILKLKLLNQKFKTSHFLSLYIIYVNRNIWLSKRLTKATLLLSPRKMLTSATKKIIPDTSIFQQINIEEDKQFNFPLESESKDTDLVKSLETEGKISEKEYELIYPRVCMEVQKSVINNCPKILSYFVSHQNTYLLVS